MIYQSTKEGGRSSERRSFTERKVEIEKDGKSAQDVPSESNSLAHLQIHKIQTIIETVQAQLNKFTYRDSKIIGTHLAPEWCDDKWKHVSLLSEPVGKFTNITENVCTGFSSASLCG